MQISKGKAKHAMMIMQCEQNDESYLGGLKKSALLEELSWYGVNVSRWSGLSRQDLRMMYMIVLGRVCRKYKDVE